MIRFMWHKWPWRFDLNINECQHHLVIWSQVQTHQTNCYIVWWPQINKTGMKQQHSQISFKINFALEWRICPNKIFEARRSLLDDSACSLRPVSVDIKTIFHFTPRLWVGIIFWQQTLMCKRCDVDDIIKILQTIHNDST